MNKKYKLLSLLTEYNTGLKKNNILNKNGRPYTTSLYFIEIDEIVIPMNKDNSSV
jgi:hypothetical protein